MWRKRELMLKIYNKDCLEKLPKIETVKERTVIITSPPYNMNLRVGKPNKGYKARGFENSSSELIATKYKNYRDDLPMEVYYDFQKRFLTTALEKVDTVFYNIQMITGNKVALFKLIGDFAENIKEVIIWDKLHGQPAVRDGVLNSRYEFLFILANEASRRRFDNAPFQRGTLDNLWGIRVGRHKGCKAGFPEEFVEKILLSFVTKDTLVIDPFMGSGTTGVVCKRLGYNFIGIEFDKETCENAVKRIQSETSKNI
jgi:site-specific DNA-methyltransferase (adenine-specific)/modification methylase